MPTPNQIKSLSIKRCQEQVVDACAGSTSGCCGVVSCALCVKVYDHYGELIDGNLAPYDDGGYSTTVNGHSFTGVWSVDAYGECVFTVTIDGEYGQILEYTCYDSPCRAASGEVAVSEGTLKWEVYEPIPIARRTVDGCLHEFCGDCGCAPRFVCVTVSGYDCTVTGKFPFSGLLNDCGEATTVEYDYSLVCGEDTVEGTISLLRDEYTDECLLEIGVTGGTSDIIPVNCAIEGFADVTLGYNSYSISVTEAPCEGCGPLLEPCCAEVRAPPTLIATFYLVTNSTDPTDPMDTACDAQLELTMGFSNELKCPVCCADGLPRGPLSEGVAGGTYNFHAGGSGNLNGHPIEVCIVACVGELTEESRPEAESDAPEDQWVPYEVILNDGELEQSEWSKCSPVGFVINWGTAVGLTYCPENTSGDTDVILVVTEA